MHSERNFLRSLPCNALASACLEHSSDSAECFLEGALFSVVAAVLVLVSLLAAGAVACARAVLVKSREARATAARREVRVMVLHSSCGLRRPRRSARHAECHMNKLRLPITKFWRVPAWLPCPKPSTR